MPYRHGSSRMNCDDIIAQGLFGEQFSGQIEALRQQHGATLKRRRDALDAALDEAAALRAALTMDPNDQRARYFSGLSALQAGRADITYDLWTRLLVEGPRNAPWIGAIEGQIADVAAAAGRPIPEVPGAAGPTRDDVAAAADLSPAERMEMVRGMVDRLSDRLATEGGTAQEWARLISSLGVLGERGRANRIWTEAREVFADDPNGLQLIRQAAQGAEIIQ